MAVTVNLKKQVDLPVWEWCRFAPVNTQTVSCMTSGDYPQNRYMYYYSTGFYRYDTWTDQWMQLQSAPVAPATVVSMKYSNHGGYRGRVLSGTTTTILGPALRGNIFSGETIRIYGGTGNGQTKTIINVSDAKVYDAGVVTTASATSFTDSTKKWKINQWSGYQCGISYGPTGAATQRRKILFNDTTTLYFYDINYQQIDPWNNTGFNAIAPYVAPIATAGSQAMYFIEASVITVDSQWDVVPDNTSRFVINTGVIYMVSSVATQFYNLQLYDIAADAWYTRTTNGAMLYPAAVGTDITFERIVNSGGYYLDAIASTGTTRTLVDSDLTGVTIDQYVNRQIRLTSGTGMGQRRRIIANTGTIFTVNRKWDVVPDNSTHYQIWDDLNVAYIGGGAIAGLNQYNVEADMTTSGAIFDWGVVRNMSIRLQYSNWFGWEDLGVLSATKNAGGIYTINTSPVVGGSGHAIGDVVTIGANAGKVIVENITGGGAATLVSLFSAGTGVYTNTTYTQTATSGAGTGLQIAVTSTGSTGRIVTATGLNHFLKIGDPVIFNGAVETAWNTNYTVLATDSLTTLDVAITATATAVVANSNTVAILVDSAANWDPGEHVGRVVAIYTAGPAPTGQIRRITANTQTTLTLQSNITLAVNGTSRYIIHDISSFGRDEQFKYNMSRRGNTGYATTGSTTTLVDSTKSWWINQWANYKFRIISGTGFGSEITIVSNSGTTLTFAAQTFAPDATSHYIIMDTFGLCTSLGSGTALNDTTKNWVANQWVGKRVRITSGTGVSNETTITSNTATQLVAASGMGSPTTDSTYTILGIPVRGLGTGLIHMWGSSNPAIKGRYMFFPRGGASNTADRYDILTETYEYGYFYSPQSETLSTGSMYCYDGVDTIYYTKDSTGRIYSYNVNTNKISSAGTVPYGMSSAIIGNRMEIIITEDGLKYLYIMRHTANDMWRVLIFWQ